MDYVTYLTTYPEIYQGFSAMVNRTEHLSDYLYQHQLVPEGASVFSFGCGEGELELKLALEKKIELTLLDPVHLFADSFKQALMSVSDKVNVQNFYEQTFQDYQSAREFDLVMSIHSWYGLGLDQAMLDKALALVKPGGQLFINLMSKQSPVYALSQMSQAGGIGLCAEVLSEWAVELGYSHQFDLEHARRPTKTFFNEQGEVTQGAKNFMSFLLADVWENLSNEKQRAAVEVLRSHQTGDMIDVISGCLIFDKA